LLIVAFLRFGLHLRQTSGQRYCGNKNAGYEDEFSINGLHRVNSGLQTKGMRILE
jgi:hypothetical protein